MGSNWRQSTATRSAVASLKPLEMRHFRKLSETLGGSLDYVDIVGVTGSIPVAPTIFYNGLYTSSGNFSELGIAEVRYRRCLASMVVLQIDSERIGASQSKVIPSVPGDPDRPPLGASA